MIYRILIQFFTESGPEEQPEVEDLADDSKNITSVLETVEGCSVAAG